MSGQRFEVRPRTFTVARTAVVQRWIVLPQPPTSFVGRENELAEARRLLAGSRLLTLTGPGGAGKTRLATELARRSEAEFTDGAVFVELAPVRDPALVPVR